MEENAQVSGFYSIETVRYQGFNEQLLSELERIVYAFYQKPKVQALMNFYDDLHNHIFNSPSAHNLDIAQFAPELIQQLYKTFRERGFHGSVYDMLMAIAKFIDIGSLNDIKLGTSRVKAVNAIGWKYIFQKHATNKKAHPPRFEVFQPDASFNVYPSWGFNHLFKEQFDIFTEEGYTLPAWNLREGTQTFEFSYSLLQEWETFHLFSLSNPNGDVTCSLQKMNTKTSLGNILVEWKNADKYTTLFSIPLPIEPIGVNRVVLAYNNSILIYRDIHTINQFVFTSDIPNPLTSKNLSPIALMLGAPLQQKAAPIAMRDIAYYHTKATEQEQVFFLN